MKLYTFTISHFSEKSRWLLDAAGLPYREVPLVPGLHMPRTLWLSRRGTSVPILETDDGARIQDSRRILQWFLARPAQTALVPRSAAAQAEVLALDAQHAAIGVSVLRIVYAPLLENPALLLKLWTLDASRIERPLMRTLLPRLMPRLRQSFGINPKALAAARAQVAATLDDLDARLADGRPYLMGDRFGVADIGVCALLAPLAAPAAHPVYGSAACRALFDPEILGWQARPSMQWLCGIYRDHRGRAGRNHEFEAARRKLDG